MFKKLISYLPYNPSLIDQVSFYAKRLHRESALRRAGFVFMSLAMFVQMFVAIYPSQKSLASSANNILNGITNRGNVLNAWDNNIGDVREIYGMFNITRADIADMVKTTINSGDGYWSVGRLSLDQINGSGSADSWGERAITVAATDPDTTIYQRPLKAWDRGSDTNYEALVGTNSSGVTFWIIKDCGNPTFKTAYLPKEPKPAIQVRKQIIGSDRTVNVGDTVKYMVTYENTVPNSLAKNFRVTDTIDSNFQIVSSDGNQSGNTVSTAPINLGYGGVAYPLFVTVKVKSGVTTGQELCNQARATADGGLSDVSENVCVTVIIPQIDITPVTSAPKDITVSCPSGYTMVSAVCIPYCKYPDQKNLLSTNPYCGQCPSGETRSSVTLQCYSTANTVGTIDYCGLPGKEGLLASDPNCNNIPTCSSDQELFNGSCVAKCSAGQTRESNGSCSQPTTPSTPTVSTPASPAGVCVASTSSVSGSPRSVSIKTQLASLQGGAQASSYEYDIDANGSWDYKVSTSDNPYTYVVNNLTYGIHPILVRTTLSNGSGSVQTACNTTTTIYQDPQVIETKTVTNLSKNGKNADGNTANAGDVLEFTLTTKNITNATYNNYSATDYFGDVLEYAAITNMNELSTQGITLDSKKNLSWNIPALTAGQSVSKTVHITINKSLARTNQPTKISNSYDCRISNRFGNQVNINLNCPLVKALEQTAVNSLPNTGPGAGVIASITAAVITGYFFARSRLMAKEMDLVKSDFTSVGGI